MVKYNVSITQEAQFAEVIDIIQQHKSNASQVVNNEILLTAWYVGKYVSENNNGQTNCPNTIWTIPQYFISDHIIKSL